MNYSIFNKIQYKSMKENVDKIILVISFWDTCSLKIELKMSNNKFFLIKKKFYSCNETKLEL